MGKDVSEASSTYPENREPSPTGEGKAMGEDVSEAGTYPDNREPSPSGGGKAMRIRRQ